AEAASAWRQRMEEETGGTANDLIERLSKLQAKTGVHLASVSDRVQRPFTAMLEQDELESLVEPAVRELLVGEPQGAGNQLETHAEEFLGVATGAGVEVPDWLDHLSATVDRVLEEAEAGGLVSDDQRQVMPSSLAEPLCWSRLPWPQLLEVVSRKQGRL
ncbi:MAG: hypothetical protein KAT44_15135, partial [Pirellulales bacterium]|nr:hypothetical protein [Pirellulales bacterium]